MLPTTPTAGATAGYHVCGEQVPWPPRLSLALPSSLRLVPAACRNRELHMAVSLRPRALGRRRGPGPPPVSPSPSPSACGPTACRTSPIRIQTATGRYSGREAGSIRPRYSSSTAWKPASLWRRPGGCLRGRRLQDRRAVPRDDHGTVKLMRQSVRLPHHSAETRRAPPYRPYRLRLYSSRGGFHVLSNIS